jgi:hypothetical protein
VEKTLQIVAGDTVKLKSGGVLMTVGAVNYDLATCYFFSENKDYLEKQIPLIALIKANPTRPGSIRLS